MPQRIQCPDCDERISVPARLKGKKITCSECGYKFLPADDEDEDEGERTRDREGTRRPRKSARSEEKGGKRTSQGPAIPVAAWIGGGVMVIGVIGAGLFFALRTDKKAGPEPDSTEKAKEQNPAQPNPRPPKVDAPGGSVPHGSVPHAKTDPDEDRALAAGWAVTVDPSERKVDYPDKTQTMATPLGDFGSGLYLPSTASPFFAVGGVNKPTDSLTVFDIRTKQQAGVIRGKTDLQPPVALSPDGKYLAGKSGFKSVIDVYDFTTGKGVRTFDPKTISIQSIDFGVNNDEVVVLCSAPNLTDKVLQAWTLATGGLHLSIPLPKQVAGQPLMALSPGRHLVAVTAGKYVWVYRLADGKLIGARPLPDLAEKNAGFQSLTCEGLAFSVDGTELAVLFKNSSQRSQIAAWNVGTGKLEQHLEVTDALGNGLGPQHANNLEYLPDGQGWLVRSNFVIDRQSGAALMQLQPQNPLLASKMRIVSNDMMLMVTDGKAGKKSVVTAPFDRAAFDAAAQAARAAVITVAAKPGDRTGVIAVAPAGAPAWAVTADPAATGKPFPASIALANPGHLVRGAFVGSPESARAATLSVIDVKTPFPHKVARWDRYDFSSGRHLGAVDLGTVKNAPPGTPMEAALSPRGERLAVRSLAEPNRIDVWSADGKSLGGFLPSGSPVGWLGFLAEDKLLTLAGNQVTLWEVPSFKAVYETGASYRGIPALSANRRWLAVCNGSGFDVLEAATGSSRGRIAADGDPAPNQNAFAMAAFSLDGAKFAGVVATPTGGGTIVLCDLTSGETTQTVPTTAPRGRLQWCGASHLLQDSNLIDPQAKMTVWNYLLRGQSVRELTDGRYWRVEDGPGNTVPGALVASTLPDASASKILAAIAKSGDRPLVGPGTNVSIKMNMPGEGDPNFAKDATEQLTQALERKGLGVTTDAPVILSVNSTVESTNQLYELQALGAKTSKRTIPLKKLTVVMSLTDRSGRMIWQDKQSISQNGALRIFRADENVEKILATDMWNTGKAWVSSPRLPSRVYLIDGNPVILPGSSAMTPDR